MFRLQNRSHVDQIMTLWLYNFDFHTQLTQLNIFQTLDVIQCLTVLTIEEDTNFSCILYDKFKEK